MSRLPEGWRIVRIGDVCKTGAGGTPLKSNKEYYEGGSIPWLLSGEVSQGEIFRSKNFITEEGLANSSAKIFPVNSVLVAMYGATAAQVGILRCEVATNQAICGIYPNSNLLPEYIFYAVLSKQSELIATATGNAQPNISQIKIKNTHIPLPPLLEQKRIVSILDEVFARIAKAVVNAKKNLANARELFESILQSAIEGKFSPEASIEGFVEDHLEELESKSLPVITEEEIPFSLPKYWRWIRLGSIAKFINGDRGKNYPNKKEYVLSGIPWINTGHIHPDGSLSVESMNYITKEKFDLLRSGKIEKGDLVYCLRGATIGKTAFVVPYTKGAVASSLVIIRPENVINRKYLYYFLTSPFGQKLIKRFDNGAAQPNLGANSVKKYITPLPPMSEQIAIIKKLDALSSNIQHVETIYREKLTALTKLKQSVLQKAFAGELTADAIRQQATI